MPELPEVETIRRSLEAVILNKKIIDVSTRKSKVVRATDAVLRALVIGRAFRDIGRVGKLLIFSLSRSDDYVLVHLKMTGQLIYTRKKLVVAGGHSQTKEAIRELPNKYTHLTVTFSDESRLFLNDMRLFAYLDIVDEKTKEAIVARFGPEPIAEHFAFAEFVRRIKPRRTSIKAVILNQSIVAGIGNIYADEICFAAGVRPGRRASSLTVKEMKKLFLASRAILQHAIKERGTTFNTFIDGAGKKGNFVKFLKVYGRGGEPCVKCRTLLEKIKVAGRGTVFCQTCQR